MMRLCVMGEWRKIVSEIGILFLDDLDTIRKQILKFGRVSFRYISEQGQRLQKKHFLLQVKSFH